MEPQYRRFVIKGTKAQQRDLEKLIEKKHLSREDLILILHTIAFRNPCFDTLMKQSLKTRHPIFYEILWYVSAVLGGVVLALVIAFGLHYCFN